MDEFITVFGPLLREVLGYDTNLFKHCVRVCRYAILMGLKLGLDDERLLTLWKAAILHDYGKIFVNKNILFKPGRLTVEEFEEMKQHVTRGCVALRQYGIPEDVIAIISEHHESPDGKGYPTGKTGLSESGQILRFADVFDALTEKRPYKDAMPEGEVIRIMTEEFCFDETMYKTIKSFLCDEFTRRSHLGYCFHSVMSVYRCICNDNE